MGGPFPGCCVPAQVTLFRGAGLTLARSEASTCRSGSPSLGRKEESQASLSPAPPAPPSVSVCDVCLDRIRPGVLGPVSRGTRPGLVRGVRTVGALLS